jgi:hypothetical protein
MGLAVAGLLVSAMLADARVKRGVPAGDQATVEATQAQEALLAAPALAAENERLRAQVSELEARVSELTLSLAEARYALDRWKVGASRLPAEPAVADSVPATGLAVLDANRELALVVLEGGSRSGLKPGVSLAVVRAERVLARVRVVDVRERIAGARIEALMADEYPERGDRAVVWRTTM